MLIFLLALLVKKAMVHIREKGEEEIAEKGILINHPRPIPLQPSPPSESEGVEGGFHKARQMKRFRN